MTIRVLCPMPGFQILKLSCNSEQLVFFAASFFKGTHTWWHYTIEDGGRDDIYSWEAFKKALSKELQSEAGSRVARQSKYLKAAFSVKPRHWHWDSCCCTELAFGAWKMTPWALKLVPVVGLVAHAVLAQVMAGQPIDCKEWIFLLLSSLIVAHASFSFCWDSSLASITHLIRSWAETRHFPIL